MLQYYLKYANNKMDEPQELCLFKLKRRRINFVTAVLEENNRFNISWI